MATLLFVFLGILFVSVIIGTVRVIVGIKQGKPPEEW